MIENQEFTAAFVIGPLGEMLTVDMLPPPNHTRWTIRRKAEVVAAIGGQLLTLDEACNRYCLTIEEIASWQRSIERSGMQGLRVTRLQYYRDKYKRHLAY